jgi:Domain of unknown function (DUF6249)
MGLRFHLILKGTIMKIRLLACIASFVLAMGATAQTPTPASAEEQSSPTATVSPASTAVVSPSSMITASPGATLAPVTTVSPARSTTSDDLQKRIEKKVRKHLNVSVDDDAVDHDFSDVPWLAIPIVTIVFLTIFGTPILIVAVILYFSFSKTRALHRTVRMMVEKGQPVPEALLNPPPAQRQRSDMRRGVVLTMVGLGLMLFFAAVNDWEGGAWSIGLIPFLIGAGYLLVWKLEGKKDNVPPVP